MKVRLFQQSYIQVEKFDNRFYRQGSRKMENFAISDLNSSPGYSKAVFSQVDTKTVCQ